MNESKRGEVLYLFKNTGYDINFLDYDVGEVLSNNVEYVVKKKVVEAYRYWRLPVIVEHGALEVECFNLFPGALSKPMWDMMNDKICELIPENEIRTANVLSCVGYCDGKIVKTFLGKTKGTITENGRGENGFQFDPIFCPNGSSKTYAEMRIEEKMSYSQAYFSYNLLIDFLNGIM